MSSLYSSLCISFIQIFTRLFNDNEFIDDFREVLNNGEFNSKD